MNRLLSFILALLEEPQLDTLTLEQLRVLVTVFGRVEDKEEIDITKYII